MHPIGIRPTNDFAFKKTFGSPENKLALVSLLNAILTLPVFDRRCDDRKPVQLAGFPKRQAVDPGKKRGDYPRYFH